MSQNRSFFFAKRRHGLARGNVMGFRSAQSEGGAKPRVKQNADVAEMRAGEDQVPWLLAKMYRPSPIVNTDQSRNEGENMVQRLYIPITPEAVQRERPAFEKLKNWFLKGKYT